jgi:hypothetical protein
MDTNELWPEYLLERAIRLPPENCSIVIDSTPVIAFGNPTSSTVATLGINPSKIEFCNSRGDLFEGTLRRLATLKSLDVRLRDELGSPQGDAILNDCATYFERKPYKWFKPLERILFEGAGASYHNDQACHLDLVQWATDPIWGQLNPAARRLLLDDGLPFLQQLLSKESFQIVIVNGRTVLKTVEQLGLTEWSHEEHLDGPPPVDLYLGTNRGLKWLGWSCNLQSQPGALKHVGSLISFVERQTTQSSELNQ